MAFASGKTFALADLVPIVDTLKAQPQLVRQAVDSGNFSAFSDPDFAAKLNWLSLHFSHKLDQDNWLQTLTSLPQPQAYKHLLLSFPDHLKQVLLQAIGVESHYFAPQEVRLSAPHEAYLRLHSARNHLSDSQTAAFINQQKLANAAKAINQLQTQGVTQPDKYQIHHQLQAGVNHTHTHTANLIRQVNRLDLHLIDQLQQSFQHVINSQPTTIPQAEIANASRELANLSYQSLKPYLPLVSSPADLTNILKDQILTPDRINRIPALAAYKIPPDLFHHTLATAAKELFRRYVKPLQTPLRLVETYGEHDYHNAFTTAPPPADPAHRQAQGLFLAQGYPGEALINAANPHAAENAITSLPKSLWHLVTSPLTLAFGNVETSFVSLAVTYQQQQVKFWAVQRSFSFLPSDLQARWQTLFQAKDAFKSAQFDPLFQDTQAWIRSQVHLLHAGSLKVDLDTREKLLEINNNLNLLELGLKQRAFLEKIPGLRNLLHLSDKLSQAEVFGIRIFNPMVTGYTKAFLSLAFRSDPLTALGILADYGAVRPLAQGIWRSVVIPSTRHLPFGWDVKQGTFGVEVYWKPTKWLKDKTKESLLWLADKTGLKKAGEWVAQNIFKTTFAKLAGVISGLFGIFLLTWEWVKKSIKATAGIALLFLATHGPGAALAAAIGGPITAWAVSGLAVTGAVLLGITSLPVLALIAIVTFVIALPIAAILWALIYLKSIGFFSSLASWFTGSLLPGVSQFFASLGSITLPTIPTWVFATGVGSLIGYQIYQANLRNTALMAPSFQGGTLEDSAYIEVTKTVRRLAPNPGSPSPQLTFSNSDLPVTVEYTLTVTAEAVPLENVVITDTQTITSSGPAGQPVSSVSEISLPPPPSPLTTWSTTYTLSLDPAQHQDSLIVNNLTVTADVVGGPGGEQSLASAAVIVGNPPVSCPWGWPTQEGYITQGPKTRGTHGRAEAIDIGVGEGTPIFATSNGVANIGTSDPIYGNYIDIITTCNGRAVNIRYAHLSAFSILPGSVTFGQQIGESGNTGASDGPHLHYHFREAALLMGSPYIPIPRDAILGCVEKTECSRPWNPNAHPNSNW